MWMTSQETLGNGGDVGIRSSSQPTGCWHRLPGRPQAGSYVGCPRELVGARLRATDAADSIRRILMVVVLGCMARWRIALVRCCGSRETVCSDVGMRSSSQPTGCWHRLPGRPQAGSYVGCPRELVGARLRATDAADSIRRILMVVVLGCMARWRIALVRCCGGRETVCSDVGMRSSSQPTGCWHRLPGRPQAGSYVGCPRELVGARLRATDAADSIRRILMVVVLGCMARWRIALVRCCGGRETVCSDVGMRSSSQPTGCWHRLPGRPQAGSYVGCPRELVGARLRATDAADSIRRILMVVVLGCMARWRIALVRCCGGRETVCSNVGMRSSSQPTGCWHRLPGRPQAGSYVGCPRELVGARLRATDAADSIRRILMVVVLGCMAR
jgi:hypothetical protein